MITKKNTQQDILKERQQEIIDYLFQFRHLTLPQIQQLLHHKNHAKVRIWLKNLSEQGYIFKIYKKEIDSKPSEYCLDKASIPYLREKGASERIIKRVYKEKKNSQNFRNRCKLLATVYISLLELTEKNNAKLDYYTKDTLRKINYFLYPLPDCYFAITDNKKHIDRYFLDTFDDGTYIYKRVYEYLDYYKSRSWQKHTTKSFPKIILVCSENTIKQRIYKFIQKKLTEESPAFYVSTKEEIQTQGICKEVLQKVRQV